MPDSEAISRPGAFAAAPLDEAVGRLVAEIRRVRPQVIVTYGDDHSGYPHPDHIRVHDISVAAFEQAGDPDAYPEAGEPFQPLKLYYTVWSRQRILETHAKFLELGLESPFDDKWFERRATRTRSRPPSISPATRTSAGMRSSRTRPGRSHLEVLVRPAPRGDADDPPLRRLQARPQPRRQRAAGDDLFAGIWAKVNR